MALSKKKDLSEKKVFLKNFRRWILLIGAGYIGFMILAGNSYLPFMQIILFILYSLGVCFHVGWRIVKSIRGEKRLLKIFMFGVLSYGIITLITTLFASFFAEYKNSGFAGSLGHGYSSFSWKHGFQAWLSNLDLFTTLIAYIPLGIFFVGAMLSSLSQYRLERRRKTT